VARDRIEQFDGLRAFAFLAVFTRHVMHVRCTQFGVDLFFVLSGFLITRNLVGMGAWSRPRAFKVFFYHRVLRIIPPYYLALVCIIATGYLTLGESPWYFTFTSNIRDSIWDPIGGPAVTMWSICIEEQFYLVWPFVMLLMPKRSLVPIFIAIIVAAPLVRYGFRDNSDAVYRLTITRMDLLALGALLGFIDLRDPAFFRERRVHVMIAGALAVAIFATLAITMPMFEDTTVRPQFIVFGLAGYSLVAIACGAILILARTDTGWFRAFLSWGPLRYVGRISYMAYLIHLLVIKLLLEVPMPGPVRAVIALAGTLTFATLSWYFVETPIQKLRLALDVQRP
jgi:peptidoglycan/LPS O-acetylase OafA/YrhL